MNDGFICNDISCISIVAYDFMYLKNKALANNALPTGRYPLCMAADYGQLQVIEYLVENGADVNVS
jgi:ankyrin repeat protein